MWHIDLRIHAYVRHTVIATLTTLAASASLQAGDLFAPPGLEGYYKDNSDEFAALALHHLNELSARRRLTTVFPNEQSPFYGVQLNYVNVREGNLTFLMRGMVRSARVPIVFGRVYDSRKEDEAIARAEYDDGRLSIFRRLDSYHPAEQRFHYDAFQRLTRVVEEDEVIAEYGYDASGRVTYAWDGSSGYSGSYGSHGHSGNGYSEGERGGTTRRYRFDGRGELAGLSMNDTAFGYRTNRFGMIERVTWAEDHVLDLDYADTDRVQTLRFSNAAANLGVEYQYDNGGFRVSGRYDALQTLGDTEVVLDYDPTGNLIRMGMPGQDGGKRTIQHTIGRENQLLLLTPLGSEAFEQAFEYDQSGRPIRTVQGNGQREALFSYDELGRLTDVYLDGEHVLTSSHGPMDLDPVHASHDYSAYTATAGPVASSVFGSLDEIIYTRPFGTPYGIVRFVPDMARFVVGEHPIVPPDSLVLASLRRRNLASESTLNPSPLLGFDKPSSSLFVPPEFFTANCSGCVGNAYGFDLDRVGSGAISVGQTITFEADATFSECYYWWLEGYYDLYTAPNSYRHVVEFLGGGGIGSTTYTTSTNHKQFSGSYTTPGSKTVRDALRCSCGNIFLAEAEELTGCIYSWRNARIGSMRAARRAGNQVATIATVMSRSRAAASTDGSAAATSGSERRERSQVQASPPCQSQDPQESCGHPVSSPS